MNHPQPLPDFWPVVATTLPVLALALVLESRWVIGRAHKEDGMAGPARATLALHGSVLLLMGLVEYKAIWVLAGTDVSTHLSRQWAVAATTVGFTTLALTPGLSILLAGLSSLLAWLPSARHYA